MKIFCKYPTVNISKLNFWFVICVAKNLIWTTLKAIFSILHFPAVTTADKVIVGVVSVYPPLSPLCFYRPTKVCCEFAGDNWEWMGESHIIGSNASSQCVWILLLCLEWLIREINPTSCVRAHSVFLFYFFTFSDSVSVICLCNWDMNLHFI